MAPPHGTLAEIFCSQHGEGPGERQKPKNVNLSL